MGYKYPNPFAYNHEEAGPPTQILDIGMHAGAHAYAITYITAEMLLKELNEKGVYMAIDNYYFIREFPDAVTSIPMAITDPVCAMGWIRESTIWNKPMMINYTQTLSFIRHANFDKLREV